MKKQKKIGWQKYEDVIEDQVSNPFIEHIVSKLASPIEESKDLPEEIQEMLDISEEDDIMGDLAPGSVPISNELVQELSLAINYDCWVGHANFDITPSVMSKLKRTEGVEALKIILKTNIVTKLRSLLMKREILNEKIKTALKDPDIIAMTKAATKSYKRSLNEEELKSCILNALSRSILNFDPSKNSKFTTYLHKGLKIECLTQIKKNKPLLRFSTKATSKIDERSEMNMRMIEVMDEIERLKDGHLVVDKYLNNYTCKEIGEKNGIHPETVRTKIKKTLESLRTKME